MLPILASRNALMLFSIFGAFVSNSTSAFSAPVSYSELEGKTAEVKILRGHTFMRNGKEISGNIDHHTKIKFGPGDLVSAWTSNTWSDQKGDQPAKITTGSAILGRPQHADSYGGGYSLSTFSDGVLTYIRTFQQGGWKMTVHFERSQSGLSCKARQRYMKEKGAAGIRTETEKGENWVIKDYQISSQCSVRKE